MSLKEAGPIHLAVSRKTFGFVSDRKAFAQLREINEELGVHLDLELTPHRFVTPEGLRFLEAQSGIQIVGIHGPLQPEAPVYIREALRNITKKPADYKEALLQLVWLVGFGPLHEPRWLKRYGSHLELARTLGTYLVMHEEPLRALGDELVRAWSRQVKILRENGWGPKDGRPDPLSWDPQEIRRYADEHGCGTVLDTATAARNGQNIVTAWEILQPEVIHFSDRLINPRGLEQENLPPGRGAHAEELQELLGEIRRQNGVVLVLEVEPTPDARTAIAKSLEFIQQSI